MSLESSILSYPERGPYGDNNYRGNCTGYLLKDLFQYFNPKTVLDPMEGSGTTRDVCKELGIEYTGFDLKEGHDLTGLTITKEYDFIFFHPPYWDAVKYSDDKNDLSNCSYKEFENKLKICLETLSSCLSDNGHLAVLIGDRRKKGNYYPLFKIVLDYLDERLSLKNILIKQQHNVRSRFNDYGNIIPILHEYLLIYRKLKSGGK